VAWTVLGTANLSPSTPVVLSPSVPHSGSFTLSAGSFGSYGLLHLAYPVYFESSRYRGVEMWIRSDSASPFDGLALSVVGATASTPVAAPPVTSTWQLVSLPFAGNSVPARINTIRLLQ
jgi:hypothetical protein